MTNRRRTPTTAKETRNSFVYGGVLVAIYVWYFWHDWLSAALVWTFLTLALGAIFNTINDTISQRAFKRGYLQGQDDAKQGIDDPPVHPLLMD